MLLINVLVVLDKATGYLSYHCDCLVVRPLARTARLTAGSGSVTTLCVKHLL